MKTRLFTTYYWGYRKLTEEDVTKMNDIEKIFVIDRFSKRDNLQYESVDDKKKGIEIKNEKTE